MASYLARPGVAAIIVILCILGATIRRTIAFWAMRKRTGCRLPVQYPHRDPIFGYDLYRQRRRALKEGNHMALYMRDFRRLGKTWEEMALTRRIINTMDPVNHQHVYTTGINDFARQPRPSVNRPVLGSGILMLDGEPWKRSRNVIKPIFARAEVGNVALLAHHVDRFLTLLPRDGATFDIQPMLKKLTADLATEFLVGEPIGAQAGDAKAVDFLSTFEEVLLGWNKRRQAGVLFARYAFDKKWPAALQRLYAYLDAHVNRALVNAVTEQESKDANPDADPKPSGRYILLPELVKRMRDPVALRFELLNVYIGSQDGPAALVSNILWVLARHPHVWQQLRQCASEFEFDASNPPATSITNLASLRLFRHVIYETLRVIGPAPRNLRKAQRDTVLPRGGGPDGQAPIFVSRGTTICTVTYGIHHDPDVWGADADDFRPARWAEAEEAHAKARPPWTFVPFLGGSHVCPGQQQLLVQATYILYRMVREFEMIECRDDVLEYVELQRMVIESKRGVVIALYRRR